MNDETIYLDNNATTRPYREVLDAMRPFFNERFGNPSSVHQIGRDAKTALDEARSTVAEALNAASPAEIVFVSCATEANTLALRGVIHDVDRTAPRIVTSQVEHPSVLETCEALEEEGKATVEYVPVNGKARISPARVREAVTPDTALVSIMTANNEVGTVQPMREISDVCSEHGVPLHTDAVQAPAKIPIDVRDPSVDLLSLSAHKFHGPRGIGVLYRRKGLDLEPVLRGGGQEQELRSGTEPVALAAGIARAIEIATERRDEVADHVDRLRRRLRDGIRDAFGETVELNSEADKMLINLDLEGICVSAGSACHSGAIEISHVLDAMDVPEASAKGSVRFSLSHETTEEEIDLTLNTIRPHAP